MKDIENNIIYVGKAKDLYKRVNSYFKGSHDYKTTKLVLNIFDFDYIVTKTEKEAFVLELNLIKKHNPKYNICFMDDKTYPYVKLEKNKYPSLTVVRERKKDVKSSYYGPYPDVISARETIKLLNQLYPLRKCRNLPKKVCLYYHMKQWLGPCEYNINSDIFNDMINKVDKFLKGDVKDVLELLEKRMENEQNNLEYEKAIITRDLIASINSTIDKQNVELKNVKNTDVFNYYYDKGFICIQGLFVRNNKLLDKIIKLMPVYGDIESEFISYISQYYSCNNLVNELILPNNFQDIIDKDVIDIKITYPHHGVKQKLLDMALLNAKEYLESNYSIQQRKFEIENNIDQDLYNLYQKKISRIEVFDNSNISGKNNVSGMVVFINGKPSKKDYRIYKLNDQIDDLASMHEVIYRRYFRLLKEGLSLPDMIIVDGGKNQIDVAKNIIDALGLNIIVCGLVKDDKHRTAGLMDTNHKIFDIDKNSELFMYLTIMQDEVHRFALNYHKKLRNKGQTHSLLDDVKGLGAKRKKLLYKHFKTYKRIKDASIEELAQVVPYDVAVQINKLFIS